MHNSIGLIELSSIAYGFFVADTMMKAADVELLLSRTICSGKYIILVGGDVGAVKTAVVEGRKAADFTLIDDFIIPNVHEKVFPAIRGNVSVNVEEALGILESFSVSALIEGADAACKEASVDLIEIRLAMALGGKAFATMTGTVADVKAAIAAGAKQIADKGLLVNKIVIPYPVKDIYKEII